MLALALIMGGFCAYRLILCFVVYQDARAKGADAVSWLGVVSVGGIIGFVIWFATRPRPQFPYFPAYGFRGPAGYYPPPQYGHYPQPGYSPGGFQYYPAPPPVYPPPSPPGHYPYPAVPPGYPAPSPPAYYQHPAVPPGYPPPAAPAYYPPPAAPARYPAFPAAFYSPHPAPPAPFHPPHPAQQSGPSPPVPSKEPAAAAPGQLMPHPVPPPPGPPAEAGTQPHPAAPVPQLPPPPQPAAGPRFNPFAVHRMAATFVAAMAITVIIQLPMVFALMAMAGSDITDQANALNLLLSPAFLLIEIAIQDAILVFLVYLAMLGPGHLTLKGIGASLDRLLPKGIVIGLLGGLALFGAASGIGYLLESTGLFPTGEGIFLANNPSGLVLMLIATVAIAPPAEELFFRAYALEVLEKKWGAVAGVTLSALLFSVVHLSLFSLLPIFAAGVGLALLFRRWGIWPCIVAHGVNNFLAVILPYLGIG